MFCFLGGYIFNPELSLLKLLLKKDAYNKYQSYIDTKYLEENHREISFLYKILQQCHELKEGDVTLDELASVFFTQYPQNTANSTYSLLLDQINNINITDEIGQKVLDTLLLKKKATALADYAFQTAQGQHSEEELLSFLLSFSSTKASTTAFPLTLVDSSLEELITSVYAKPGLRWRLNCLNKSLGSLRKGDFGFVFARPETGKTTFLASEITSMLRDSQSPVIWFNNEEDGKKVKLRVYQAYFGITVDTLFSNYKKYEQQFKEQNEGKFFLFDSGIINKKDVEFICRELEPELVIYDQIDKLRGFAADRDDLKLGAIYQWARELAKNSHAAIGICQADGTAEGVRYLTMEHVANAKTSKQAEADWILGIGKPHDNGLEYCRYFNISKNKLIGDKDTKPEFRHGRFEVLIRPEIARYEDIIIFE